MIVKIKDKEYSFDGYVNPISSVQRLAEGIYEQGKADAIDDAIHHLDNSKTNCHEDYIDGIDFAIGLLNSTAEQLKEKK